MEYFNKSQQEQGMIERFIVLIFTVYCLYLCVSFIYLRKAMWLSCLVVIAIATVWFIHVSKYRNFRVRAAWLTVIMQFVIS